MKVLIADDEVAARNRLRAMLETIYSDIEIILAKNGDEAFSIINKEDPDIAFLDIEMPKLSGIEVAYSLGLSRTKIVFVTAYSEYASKAFDINAVDYITKPFDEKRLKQSLDKTINSPYKEFPEKIIKCNRICFKTFGKNIILNYKDIYFVSSVKNYSVIQTKNEDFHVRLTLEEIIQRLPKDSFFRTHKSYIVNFDYVMEYKSNKNGQYYLKIKEFPDTPIPLSRQKLSEFEKNFS